MDKKLIKQYLTDGFTLSNDDLPMANMEFRGERVIVVQANEAYINELKSVGVPSLEVAEGFFNSKESGVHSKFIEFRDKCLKSGKVETMDVVIRSKYVEISMYCQEAEDSGRYVKCKVIFFNLSEHDSAGVEAERKEALQNLYSLYDYINALDLNGNKIRRLYNSRDNEYRLGVYEFDSYLANYAKAHIHPSERDAFLRDFSREGIVRRFRESGKRFLISFYNTNVGGDDYKWKAYILMRTNPEEENMVYSCARGVDASMEHVLIRDDYVRLINEMPLAYGIFEVDGEDVDKISDIKCMFASKKLDDLMGVKLADSPGISVYGKEIMQNPELVEYIYKAAYRNESGKVSYFAEYNDKWVLANTSQAAGKGRCAVIFEDITKERLTSERIGREWRTDDLIIACTKMLHGGLPFDEAVDAVFDKIGKSIGAKRVYLVESKDGSDVFSETHEWTSTSTKSSISAFQNMKRPDMLNWENEFVGAASLVVDDVETLKSDHKRLYQMLHDFGVHNIVEVPVYDNAQLSAYLGCTDYSNSKGLDVRELFDTISYFITAEYNRRRLMREIEKRSTFDGLCGVRNRSNLERAIRVLEHGADTTVGVVYADANGLKLVNDTKGHEAGDELLKHLSGILVRHFTDDYVYRAGGDEFVVVYPRSTRSEFEKKYKALVEDFKNAEGLSVALGSGWTAHSDKVGDLLHEADKKMYEDKANYYKKNNRRRPGLDT